MDYFRNNFLKDNLNTFNLKISKYADYLKSEIYYIAENKIEKIDDIPSSNVLRYWLEDGSWFAIRPSGTEPKLKIYIYSYDKNKNNSKIKLDLIKSTIDTIIDSVK